MVKPLCVITSRPDIRLLSPIEFYSARPIYCHALFGSTPLAGQIYPCVTADLNQMHLMEPDTGKVV